MPGGFAVELEKFAKETEEKLKKAARAIALESYGRVVRRSPVDTGRFKANWGTSVGQPGGYGNGFSGIQQWNGEGSMFICNNMPYCLVLEYGSPVGEKPWPGVGPKTVESEGRIFSSQAPHGMVRLTVAEMKEAIKKLATKV